MAKDPIVLGRIAGLFGVRGWVKVFSHTEPREAVVKYDGLLYRKRDEWLPLSIVEGRRHAKTVIARIAAIDDREQAATMVGAEIGIRREALPEPGNGQYYWSDLEGLKVVDEDGTDFGRVSYMLETGANDVMVLQGERERLIPFVMEKVVKIVDLEKREIVVSWEWE